MTLVTKGLIYAGGESLRMGLDKGSIPYYGIPQRDHLAAMVSGYVRNVYLSCHPARVPESSFPILPDVYPEMGPMGGLLTGFGMDANCAWLTLPCDMPLVDLEIIAELLEARHSGKMATSFVDPESGFPEPLFVIWEPSILPKLLMSKDEGNFSLKRILMEVDCAMVKSVFPEKLRNVNTPEDCKDVMRIIGEGKGKKSG